jgi:hypothetical protein
MRVVRCSDAAFESDIPFRRINASAASALSRASACLAFVGMALRRGMANPKIQTTPRTVGVLRLAANAY